MTQLTCDIPPHLREVRHGYTLDDLDRLTRKSVLTARCAGWWRGRAWDDRYDTAWSAIAEHLCASQETPAEYDLVAAGLTALRRLTQDLRRHHGRSDNQRAYSVYWRDRTLRNDGPETRVVDRVALAQIWPRLSAKHRAVFVALATCGTYADAAASLGMNLNLWSVHISKARRAFLALWHEGETPSRQWAADTTRTPGVRQQRPTALVKHRKGRPKPVLVHGKASTYTNHKCRCRACTEAKRLEGVQRRARAGITPRRLKARPAAEQRSAS